VEDGSVEDAMDVVVLAEAAKTSSGGYGRLLKVGNGNAGLLMHSTREFGKLNPAYHD
jgi:hypothetical protein